MFDVVGIDMPCMDLNLNLDYFPRANSHNPINQYSWQGGGKVASGIVACARLGASCAMMGGVGDDIFGRFIVQDFQRHGIDTTSLKVGGGASTALSVVLSDLESGHRNFIFNRGGVPRYTFEDFDLEKIQSARYLFICHGDAANEKAADAARAAGTQVFIDADGYSEQTLALIPKIDVFIGSEFFYGKMFGNARHEENCRQVMAMGPRIAVFTLGAAGCVGVSRDGFFALPAFPVTVTDTVGAGDVYHGGFLAGLLKGYGAAEAARFASAVAAIKCTRIGGRAGIPDLATVERFLADGFIDYTEIDARVKLYERGLDHV